MRNLFSFFRRGNQQPSDQNDTEMELYSSIQEVTTTEASNPNNEETRPPLKLILDFATLIFTKENLPRLISVTGLTLINSAMTFLSPYLLSQTVTSLDRSVSGIIPGNFNPTPTPHNITISPSFTNSSDYNLSKITSGFGSTNYILMAMLLGTYTLSKLLPRTRQYLINPISANLDKVVLTKIAQHLLKKKSLQYHVNKNFSDHAFFIHKGFNLSSMYAPIVTQILPGIIEIITASAILSSLYSIEIGVSLAIMVAIYTVYSGFMTKSIIETRTLQLASHEHVLASLVGAVQRYKTIHDFDKIDYVMRDIEVNFASFVKANTNVMQSPLRVGYGHTAIVNSYMFGICLYIVYKIQSGSYNPQDFLVIYSYLTQLANLLPSFGESVNQIAASYPDLRFVFTELAKKSEIVDLYPTVPLVITPVTNPERYIEFTNVTFNYPLESGKLPKPRVLNNCSFEITQGSTVAFVSKSGGGKTTIFNLLFRYHALIAGTISVNNQDITQVGLSALQKSITLIEQKPNLFNGTIRENIKFGAPNPSEVTDDAIFALAKEANLEEFLRSFEQGLETNVGEDGKSLSGGQQQRVAILRGLLKPCAILLLDEVSASLDSGTAQDMIAGINKVARRRGCTMLVINHKLTEIQNSDKILVLDQGAIIAQGRHTELLTTCPLYVELWTKYRESQAVQRTAAIASGISDAGDCADSSSTYGTGACATSSACAAADHTGGAGDADAACSADAGRCAGVRSPICAARARHIPDCTIHRHDSFIHACMSVDHHRHRSSHCDS